ncbi:MAG TPA: phosphoglycerate dehydrogenase [Anaerolineaceae bacterium]|nr:phosphoglycerate dehydrogenase [Anaerolineaceae bacterium]
MDLKNAHILVTATSYGKNDPRLKTELEAQVASVTYNPTGKPLTSAQLAELLPGMDGFIAGLDVIDAAALKAADRLKVIARYGVGFDNVDLAAARARGIVVTNTPGANSVSVAELALALMLALARQLPEAVSAVHAGNWPRLSGISLEHKTVGILGFGAVGKQLARRLRGFDCRILAFDPYTDQAFAAENNVELVERDEVVRNADFLSLHLPLLPETRGLVNAEFLSRMKKGAYLINTSRGEVVDETALFTALDSGHLRGAGLDAFAQEPPDPANPLLKLPQVIATPHLGAQTDGATSNMGWLALQDCLAVLKGEEPKFRVA